MNYTVLIENEQQAEHVKEICLRMGLEQFCSWKSNTAESVNINFESNRFYSLTLVGGFIKISYQDFIAKYDSKNTGKEEMSEKTLRTLEYGDVVVDEDGDECFVMGRAGAMVWLSDDENEATHFSYTTPYTVLELEKKGFTIKGQTEDLVEVTLEEVARLKGIDVSKLRIKE